MFRERERERATGFVSNLLPLTAEACNDDGGGGGGISFFLSATETG